MNKPKRFHFISLIITSINGLKYEQQLNKSEKLEIIGKEEEIGFLKTETESSLMLFSSKFAFTQVLRHFVSSLIQLPRHTATNWQRCTASKRHLKSIRCTASNGISNRISDTN